MEDLGPPSSYLAVPEGVPVYSSDGRRVGELGHVLADEEADIFDGIVIGASGLPGGWRFADAPQVGRFYEQGVELALTYEEAERLLPEPSENPAAMSVDPDDVAESELTRKLRSAWDRVSGRY
ncbi:MAG: PRC-barrel domain-containing protein [Actinomycetota bacterium]|nr:PRC-barrel domain-containing protein [Actinomycetota bacterium]MDQ3720686.1 PRC-barrel domain-containing protein [Actinomycetota bacterium]